MTVAVKFSEPRKRPECERQRLIMELWRLRREGVNLDRQEVIVAELRSGWELGWP